MGALLQELWRTNSPPQHPACPALHCKEHRESLERLKAIVTQNKTNGGKNVLNTCFSSWDDCFGFLATVGKETAWDLSCLVKCSRHPSVEDRPPPLCSSARGNRVPGGKPSLREGGWQTSPPLSTEGRGDKLPIRVFTCSSSRRGKVAWG